MWFRPAASALLAASLAGLAGIAFAQDAAVAEPVAEPAVTSRVTRPKPVPIDMEVDADAVIPPPATHHLGREIAQTMHYTGAPWLVRESRQRDQGPARTGDVYVTVNKTDASPYDIGRELLWTMRVAG